MMEKMEVALVSCERYPLIKVGGLADVVGALHAKLKKYCVPRLFLPGFSAVLKKYRYQPYGQFDVEFSSKRKEKGVLLKLADTQFPETYLICNDGYFARDEVYGPGGKDYPDNPERFSFFSMAALECCARFFQDTELFHCHDWQTALLPLYLKTHYAGRISASTVFTIHNLGYQGIFSAEKFGILGLGQEYFRMDQLEFYGKVNVMKAGIIHSSVLNTVSPTYAREILTPEYGCGLDGLLATRKDDLSGIINGIDYTVWNPAFDGLIAKKYRLLPGKRLNKRALQKKAGLPERDDIPLFGFVGRLVQQKGVDLIVEAVRQGEFQFQMVVLGTGDTEYEGKMKELAAKMPHCVSVMIGYDEAYAHQIYAGSDFFLMPSRYEPCGLGQLIAMKYGTIPVVRKTGGLADTVEPFDSEYKDGCGFVFEDPDPGQLASCIQRAIGLYADSNAMCMAFNRVRKCNFSWSSSVGEYWALYEKARKKK